MNKEPLEIITLQNHFILSQLQLEEALLRAGSKNCCLLNHGSTPAIVLGLSNRLEEMVDLTLWQEEKIPLIRRFSGGGTVVVDEDTFFATFIFQDQALRQTPEQVHAQMERIYARVFRMEGFCLRENDYVIGERKFGGNAQSITRGRWLHHTSLLFNYQSKWMRYLKLPKQRPVYRKSRDHAAFLYTLNERFSSKDTLQDAFLEALHEQFACSFRPLREVESALHIPHRKATALIG
ncbi:MAG: putative lipoate-protein ligase [Chlamydiales bacterium]|jgi:lipoate-protein ligase A|nr:putative lipoate-protein ligase [Chlamydiales bacterium]